MMTRLRRNRKSQAIRNVLSENTLKKTDFIIPLFVSDEILEKKPIASLPYNFIHTMSSLKEEVKALIDEGVHCFLLFPVIGDAKKDPDGNFANSSKNILFEAVKELKANFKEAVFMADVALDPYTSHGHDGVLNKHNEVDNDETVKRLVELSVLLAKAGIDYVAPSDMMDGRIAEIRKGLDIEGFFDVGIMSYSAKFASSLYGPFRDTVGSSLKFGDKKSYQLSYANQNEAILESLVDLEEGADLLLVKPATLYLDIISKISEKSYRPVGAYHVSGEYAMACLLAEKNQLDLSQYLKEVFVSLKRAGARFIITYGYQVIKNLI